jgi:hypothetical protein
MFSKNCHVKNFGTQDLRQANLNGASPTPSPENSAKRFIKPMNPRMALSGEDSERKDDFIPSSPTRAGTGNYECLGKPSPLKPTSTGTALGGARYGTALTGQSTGGSSRNWAAGTPSCAKCGKAVYFAEQVKSVGKTFHKGCLRCTSCNTVLTPGKLTEKDGDPLCHRCYGKVGVYSET